VDRELIQKLVDAHVLMYLDGLGGNCAASTTQSNTEERADSVAEECVIVGLKGDFRNADGTNCAST
jgi:uncharacterized membrane protein